MDKINLENYKGIIFDLDGVIFNITDCIRKAVDDGIEKYQLSVKRDAVMEEVAHLIEKIQNYPVPKILLNSYELLKVEFLSGISYFKKLIIAIFLFNQFNKYKDAEATIFERIDELIANLSKKKLNLAILTNNKSSYAEEVLGKFNLNMYFNTIFGFNDVTEVKPSPEGLLKILSKWNIDPEEAIFIGDMTTDIDAGKAAKVKTICVSSGLALKDDLLKHNPDILIENTDDLIGIFDF